MVKLYEKQNKASEVFVNFEETNSVIYLCDGNGLPLLNGILVDEVGSIQSGVSRPAAELAGIELDQKGQITFKTICNLAALIADKVRKSTKNK